MLCWWRCESFLKLEYCTENAATIFTPLSHSQSFSLSPVLFICTLNYLWIHQHLSTLRATVLNSSHPHFNFLNWEKLGPGIIICCSACTRRNVSSSNKIQRNCKGLKIPVCVHNWGKLWMWVCAQSLSYGWLFVTRRPVACQALLSREFSGQKYWAG